MMARLLPWMENVTSTVLTYSFTFPGVPEWGGSGSKVIVPDLRVSSPTTRPQCVVPSRRSLPNVLGVRPLLLPLSCHW